MFVNNCMIIRINYFRFHQFYNSWVFYIQIIHKIYELFVYFLKKFNYHIEERFSYHNLMKDIFFYNYYLDNPVN